MLLTTRYVGYQLAKTHHQNPPQSNNHRTHTAFKYFKAIIPRSYQAKFGSAISLELRQHIMARTL